MKRIIAAFAFFVMATTGLVTRVSAQQQVVQASVPFGFTIGNQLLPLGTYRISNYGTGQVMIRNVDQGNTAFALGDTLDSSPSGRAKLVFDKVGDQYYLKEIFSKPIALTFPKSQSEKKAEALQGPLDNEVKTINP